MTHPESIDWEALRELEERVLRAPAWLPNEEEEALLRRVSMQVGWAPGSAAEYRLSREGAREWVSELRRHIREGSQRLSRALTRAERLSAAGDAAGARQVLEQFIATEPVPLYRLMAESELKYFRGED